MRFYRLLPLFTIVLVAYTGCVGGNQYKYIYKKPVANCINANTKSPIVDEGTISFSNLNLQVDLPVHKYFYASIFPATSVSYALTQAKISNINHEKITDIKVITVNDYNNQYKAGSDLSTTCTYSIPQQTIITDKEDLLKKVNQLGAGYGSEIDDRQILISFSNPPSTSGTKQKFIVTLFTEGGAQLSDNTQTITILL